MCMLNQDSCSVCIYRDSLDFAVSDMVGYIPKNKDQFIELYSCPETAGMAFTHVKDDVDEDVDADVNDVETFCGHG